MRSWKPYRKSKLPHKEPIITCNNRDCVPAHRNSPLQTWKKIKIVILKRKVLPTRNKQKMFSIYLSLATYSISWSPLEAKGQWADEDEGETNKKLCYHPRVFLAPLHLPGLTRSGAEAWVDGNQDRRAGGYAGRRLSFTGPLHMHRLQVKTHLSALQFIVHNVTLTEGSGCLP